MSFNLLEFCPSCGESGCECSNPAFEEVTCTNKNLELAEIKELIFDCPDPEDLSVPLTPITGWQDSSLDDTVNDASIATWLGGIDNTAGNIKRLKVIGSIPRPEETIIQLPDNETTVINRRYTGSFRVVNATQQQRNWLKWVQGCEPNLRFWYMSRGNALYGGENGLWTKTVRTWQEHGEGAEAVATWMIEVIWETRCEPARDFISQAA